MTVLDFKESNIVYPQLRFLTFFQIFDHKRVSRVIKERCHFVDLEQFTYFRLFVKLKQAKIECFLIPAFL